MTGESQLAIRSESSLVDAEAFQKYLKANLTSDLVLQILEECLVEENSVYNSIDFGQSLKELERREAGRYQWLKALLEGFATKEGLVLLDPKSVTASYKERVAQLKLLRTMGRFRRFFYRLTQALSGLLSEKTETEAIQEAIQITGEIQIVRTELTALELRRSQVSRDADQILTTASTQSREIIEAANNQALETVRNADQSAIAASAEAKQTIVEATKRATAQSEEIYADARKDMREERAIAARQIAEAAYPCESCKQALGWIMNLEGSLRNRERLTEPEEQLVASITRRIDRCYCRAFSLVRSAGSDEVEREPAVSPDAEVIA